MGWQDGRFEGIPKQLEVEAVPAAKGFGSTSAKQQQEFSVKVGPTLRSAPFCPP